MITNYSLPVDFSKLMQKGGRLDRVSLHESVRQHILLILISRYGSLRADPEFGWGFWEHDFDHAKEVDQRRLVFEREIRERLIDKEPRLDPKELTVGLRITRDALPSYRHRKMQALKKTLHIVIKGRLLENNAIFEPPPYLLYFSPVAVDQESFE